MQRIGLEYELEGLDFGNLHNNRLPAGWKMVHDGTLRDNGQEFLSDGPINIGTAPKKLEALLKYLDGHYTVSHRCSMHMHIDFNEVKGWQHIAGLILLVAHERKFFEFSPERANNHFCTSLLRSPAFYQALNVMATGYEWRKGAVAKRMATLQMGRGFRAVNTKYTSVNAQPMKNTRDNGGLGTVELRHFAPIMDVKQLTKLCNIVDGIMTAVRSMKYSRWDLTEKALNEYRKGLKDKQLSDDIAWCMAVVNSLANQAMELDVPEPRAERILRQRQELRDAELAARRVLRDPQPAPAWVYDELFGAD